MVRKLVLWGTTALLLAVAGYLGAQTAPRDLKASLALIPGLADSVDKGAFVDVVKALDEVYPGKITLSVVPFARSMDNAITGEADFHIPAARNPDIPMGNLPYKYVTEKIGSLAMVLYSNNEKKLTRKDIEAALAKGGKFPYVIEVSAGAEANCPFPVVSTNSFESSLKKLSLKRIDAIWNAQEETDGIMRGLGLTGIHRELWGMLDDVIVIQKSAKGDEVDKILSGLLKQLRASGKLDALYRKVHLPFDPWQPKS